MVMNPIHTKEYKIEVPGGHIYTRKWLPEKIVSGIPVILLHDSLGSVDLWRNFPKILAENLSLVVIAYDRLGFGRSDARIELPPLDFIEEEARTYFPFIKCGLSISSYILLGHSVGGAMSINIAARDSDCKGVVTIASQAFVEKRTVQGIENAKRKFEQQEEFERLKKWHGKKASWVLSAWTDVWLSSEFSNWNLNPCIGKLICPVLAIHGDKDEYGSKAFPEFIAGKSGGVSEIMILQDSGHMPHKEKTNDVLHAAKKFINTNCLKIANNAPYSKCPLPKTFLY